MRIAALLIAAVLAGSSEDERAMRMFSEWLDAVEQHVPGEEDAALARIVAWTADDVEAMRGYIELLSGLPNDNPARAARQRRISRSDRAAIQMRASDLRGRGRLLPFVKRAALLHTDAALLDPYIVLPAPPTPRAQKPARPRDEPEPIIDVISVDGRIESYKIANPNWQVAMDLLEALPAQPARDPIVAQWYRTIGAYFAKQDNRADAVRHFDRARRVVPDDPGVLFGEACLQETLGSPDTQNFARLARLPSGMVLIGISPPQTHFRRAETLLRRALALQPDFVEARLRLGHVLAKQQQHAAALENYARVIATSDDRVLTYYAHLFSGDAALALDRLPESRAAYERAIGSHPESQAARLGLAAALRAAGQRDAALGQALLTLTSEPRTRDTSHEPWWEYYNGDAANVERLLEDLRAPFRAP
ncbi:MAG TPA: tetratricopeptide repeat protein [Vicinamibacterales bacterium]